MQDQRARFGAARWWRGLRYAGATSVGNRAALDAAMARAPRYIAVEGTEALRAYAATLAYRNGVEAALLERKERPPDSSVHIMVPALGRIRDGYRLRRAQRSRRPRVLSLRRGLGPVLVATLGLVAALALEWLSFPPGDPEMVRRPHPVIKFMRAAPETPLPTHAPLPPVSTQALLAQVAVPILAAAVVAALASLAWQAAVSGRGAKVSWRVAYRVPGRLVIARVRTRLA